jgi:hypothetical protein
MTPDEISRKMFVSRLENRMKHGDHWITIANVLSLLDDCDMLAQVEARKRYVLFPGWIRSKNDGDWHYITDKMLVNLYGVDPRECAVESDDNPPGLIALYPRVSGDYTLPTK